jgi:hypothetical protein
MLNRLSELRRPDHITCLNTQKYGFGHSPHFSVLRSSFIGALLAAVLKSLGLGMIKE